ncbi:MAG: hypothetical protein JXO72_03960 [Vicinamibacteria bacterium]|nr:hypothetical protein [Vicinamibacteria bacterium]
MRWSLMIALLVDLITSQVLWAQFTAESLPQVGQNPGGIAYWETPYFGNAMYNGGGWMEYAEGEWGTDLSLWQNPQFDENGFPKYLNPGRKLRAITYALHSIYGDARPATWPVRDRLGQGRIALTWKGNADVRLDGGGVFLPGPSSGPETGRLLDGRRIYLYEGDGNHVSWLDIHDIDSADPITDIKVWLADPADPTSSSLENRLFHPTFLARLAEADWGFVRFMDFLDTNGNPQKDWSDRRLPAHAFMTGTLNPRQPATGIDGDRPTGVAFEHMVALCNAADKDCWLCVPHLATDDFVTRLARLIRFGSDGVNPYDHEVSNPAYPPLEQERRVYVEYSNEIWSGGWSFPQGNWAEEQAVALGIGKPEFNARRFCQIWRIFQEVFGGTDRLVRTAAVFTAADWYTGPFLDEIAQYGPTLSPQVEPDVIAVTTYFGNGIQDWAHEKAMAQAGTADPWFYTTESFDAGGEMRPISLPASDPYWTGPRLEEHVQQAFREWTRRLLTGDAREGGGPDAVGVGGGFDMWLRDMALTKFTTPKPIVSYEGGPSLYTDYMDGGDQRDDGITIFTEAINRRPAMRDVYRMHMNMAKSKGLWSHGMFVGCGTWSKWGQWGHLEHLDQSNSEAPKYQFMLDWIGEANALRHVDRRQGLAPEFDTPHILPVATVGALYSTDVVASGGDGAPTLAVIGSLLPAGLHAAPVAADPSRLRISGTPAASEPGYLYVRAEDQDHDPAWRTFSVRAVGGSGMLLESDFSGSDPARHLPWNKTYFVAQGVQSPGWEFGPGALPRDGDNALTWTVNAPAEMENATLELAIADGEYLSFKVQAEAGRQLDLRDARVRFTIRRIDYHCPRRYAVFTSVGGFSIGAALFNSETSEESGDLDFEIALPSSPAYGSLSGQFEIRIYGYAGQYGGHKTSLIAFSLGGTFAGAGSSHPAAPRKLRVAH